MNIKYGIASFNRPECKTLNTLINIGINKNDIVIGLNNKNDVNNYKYNDIKIIYNEGDCVAFNRNRLLDYFDNNTFVIILDDDIKHFKIWRNNGSNYGILDTINNKSELEKYLINAFNICIKNNIKTFGTYSNTNTMMISSTIKNKGIYEINKIYQGGFCGFINDKAIRYDEQYKVLDDYELVLRLIKNNKNSIRINNLVADKGTMGKNKGGYFELYKTGIQEKYMKRLKLQYGSMIKIKEDYKGIKLLVR